MMDYEQLKKDMEAGTQGDAWVIGDRGASIYIKGNGKPYKYAERVGGAIHDYDFGTDLEFSEADLDRMCRVPQLERIALAAEGLETYLNYAINGPWLAYHLEDAREVLAAYREATKE